MGVPLVAQIYRYPIKGLSGAMSDSALLVTGQGIKGDRSLALQFMDDPLNPAQQVSAHETPWLNKTALACQHDWPGLAALQCTIDPATSFLSIGREGTLLLQESTLTDAGRERIACFFNGVIAALEPGLAARHKTRAGLRLIGTWEGPRRYTDSERRHVSLVSEATLSAISEAASAFADERRFRCNIILKGLNAWEETSWVGRRIRIGATLLEIISPIDRCLNIDVHPESGKRDLPLLQTLRKSFGHTHTGIGARVLEGGLVRAGDQLQLINEAD